MLVWATAPPPVSASTTRTLTARGGCLECQVGSDGGSAWAALRSPDGGQDPASVAIGLDRAVPQLGDSSVVGIVEVGLGVQRGPGPVHQRVRPIGVGGDMQQSELAETLLTVLVAVRHHTDHRDAAPKGYLPILAGLGAIASNPFSHILDGQSIPTNPLHHNGSNGSDTGPGTWGW